MSDLTVRQARAADADAVADFTRDTWAEFDGGDYIADTFPEWVATDGPDQRTLVAERGGDGGTGVGAGEVVGTCQCVMVSGHEAWAQGMRVAPAARGSGVAAALNGACFDWARERGAAVCRAMVFSWNVAGLGAARGVGFAPCTEFRWASPEPDPDASVDGDGGPQFRVTGDPDAAWSAWQRSAARDHLRGLALDTDEAWALAELTRERFRWAADETAAFAVRGDGGTRGAAFRVRADEHETDDGVEVWAEYGVGAWEAVPTARALFAAIARDAGEVGADRARVLVPETPRHVSDAAYAGVDVGEEPDFVMEADLTGR